MHCIGPIFTLGTFNSNAKEKESSNVGTRKALLVTSLNVMLCRVPTVPNESFSAHRFLHSMVFLFVQWTAL
jgi:hypothetical protein